MTMKNKKKKIRLLKKSSSTNLQFLRYRSIG